MVVAVVVCSGSGNNSNFLSRFGGSNSCSFFRLPDFVISRPIGCCHG